MNLCLIQFNSVSELTKFIEDFNEQEQLFVHFLEITLPCSHFPMLKNGVVLLDRYVETLKFYNRGSLNYLNQLEI